MKFSGMATMYSKQTLPEKTVGIMVPSVPWCLSPMLFILYFALGSIFSYKDHEKNSSDGWYEIAIYNCIYSTASPDSIAQ